MAVELLRPVLGRPVEHQVLEEVADSGEAGALVAGAHPKKRLVRHDGRGGIGQKPDAQPVGQLGHDGLEQTRSDLELARPHAGPRLDSGNSFAGIELAVIAS